MVVRRKKDFVKHRKVTIRRKEASNMDKVAYNVDENFSDFVDGESQKIAGAKKR